VESDTKSAEHVGIAAAIDRIARIRGLAHRLQVFLERGLGVEPGNARARRHQRVGATLAKPQHAVEHVALVLVDHALLVALADQVADLFFRHLLLGQAAEADQAHDQPRARGQQPHGRMHDAGEEHHRQGHPGREPFRAERREPLRHEFADDDVEEGHQQEDQDGADRHRVGSQHRKVLAQRPDQPRSERIAADVPGDERDQRDPDLHGGQEALRMLGQLEGNARTAAFPRHFLQPRLARGDHGHLGHREEAIEQHQDDD
jgi:hypothetical protein